MKGSHVRPLAVLIAAEFVPKKREFIHMTITKNAKWSFFEWIQYFKYKPIFQDNKNS